MGKPAKQPIPANKGAKCSRTRGNTSQESNGRKAFGKWMMENTAIPVEPNKSMKDITDAYISRSEHL